MDWRESADKLFSPHLLFKPASKRYPPLKYFHNFSQNGAVFDFFVGYVSQQSGELLRSKCCICLEQGAETLERHE